MIAWDDGEVCPSAIAFPPHKEKEAEKCGAHGVF
jgi:hypothetical protein